MYRLENPLIQKRKIDRLESEKILTPKNRRNDMSKIPKALDAMPCYIPLNGIFVVTQGRFIFLYAAMGSLSTHGAVEQMKKNLESRNPSFLCEGIHEKIDGPCQIFIWILSEKEILEENAQAIVEKKIHIATANFKPFNPHEFFLSSLPAIN